MPHFFTEHLSGITYGVSGVSDGNMSFSWGSPEEVIRNREAFLRKHGAHLSDCVVMHIQFEDTIAVVDENSVGKGTRAPAEGVVAEALLTNKKGLILFLLTADCLPIAYYDPINKSIALAHLGRKPTGKKLAAKVVARMTEEFGTNPRDLLVLVGPGIHKDSYAIPNPEQRQSEEWQPFLEDIPNEETKIDLVGFNRDQLLRAGVLAGHIVIDPNDTARSPRFYSHYRSVRTNEPEGRFATIIGLKGI